MSRKHGCSCGGKWLYECVGGMRIYKSQMHHGKMAKVYNIKCNKCGSLDKIIRK